MDFLVGERTEHDQDEPIHSDVVSGGWCCARGARVRGADLRQRLSAGHVLPATPPPRAAYVSVATQSGYRDGLEAGRDDWRHHDRFDPANSRRYRNADHDYDRRYGPRDEYKREYRAAFERGYREGFGGGDWRR